MDDNNVNELDFSAPIAERCLNLLNSLMSFGYVDSDDVIVQSICKKLPCRRAAIFRSYPEPALYSYPDPIIDFDFSSADDLIAELHQLSTFDILEPKPGSILAEFSKQILMSAPYVYVTDGPFCRGKDCFLVDWNRETQFSKLEQDTLKSAGTLLSLSTQAKYRTKSEEDNLTGFLQKTHFERLANAAIEIAYSTNSALSYAVCDIDNLKQINTTYSCRDGDLAILHIAKILDKCLPKNLIRGRIGGNCFAFVALNFDEAELLRVLQIVLIEVGKKQFIGGNDASLQVTFSAGIASLSKQLDDPHSLRGKDDLHSLFGRAERGLTIAKQRGKNRVEIAP
ncbi:hypothetical protein BH10CYA1_BH10CYA1_04070 [soil metagenome]